MLSLPKLAPNMWFWYFVFAILGSFSVRIINSIWRNLETLVRCGLVDRIPEGKKLHKYSIYGNKTTIRIRLPLVEEKHAFRSTK